VVAVPRVRGARRRDERGRDQEHGDPSAKKTPPTHRNSSPDDLIRWYARSVPPHALPVKAHKVRVRRVLLPFAAVIAAAMGAVGAGAAPPPGVACPMFPENNVWHADVSSLPVHARSDAWIGAMGGPDRRLHPDFGPSGEAQPYGIPYTIVGSDHDRVTVSFEYADESDAGPYPFGPDVAIEGGSDRHALMLDRDRCVLYELFAC